MRITIACLVLAAMPLMGAPAPDKNKAKEIDTQAKAIIAEGNTLEKNKKLEEALAKYREAQKLNERADRDVLRLETTLTSQYLDQAKKAFEAKQYPAAVEALEKGSKANPHSSRVMCNLGVAYQLADKRKEAVDALDTCVSLLTKAEDKTKYRDLQAMVESGEKDPVAKDKAVQLVRVNALIAEDRRVIHVSDMEDDTDAGEAPTTPAANAAATPPTAVKKKTLCEELQDNKDSLPMTAGVLFNLAQCAEAAGKFEDAARYLDQYLKVTPVTGQDDSAQASLEEIQGILNSAKTEDASVKPHLERAFRASRTGHYDVAIQELQQAAKEAPNSQRVQKKLAAITDATGDETRAKAEFTRYLSMPIPDSEKKWAQDNIDSFGDRRKKYDQLVAEAKSSVSMTLPEKSGVGAAGPAPEDLSSTAQNQREDGMSKAVESARAAKLIFPLGPEANEIEGYVYLQTDYALGARHAYDSLSATGGAPKIIATIVTTAPDKKDALKNVLGYVQFEHDGIRIQPVEVFDKKQKGLVDLACAGERSHQFETTQCGQFFPVSSFKSVSVDLFNITVVTKDGHSLSFVATNNLVGLMQSGPQLRKFHNRYARLIQRYSNYEETKLGKEGMTGGEKFALVMSVVAAAGGGMAMMGNMASMASTVVAATAMGGLAALNAIQQNRADVRAMLQSSSYKFIPLDPAPLEFRLDGLN